MSADTSDPTPLPDGGRALPDDSPEAQRLYQLSLDLCSATNMEEAIAAMARPWLSTGTVLASLWTVEPDAQGAPEWMNVVARWPPRPTLPGVQTRYYVPDLPAYEVWRHHPEVEVLIDDAETDERVNAHSRSIFRLSKVRAVMMIPLLHHHRWIGFVSLSFAEPRRFTEGDRQTCQALAKLAAVVIDNRLTLDRLQKALSENRRQRQTLEGILDNLPVGVVVAELPSVKLQMQNREVARILGQALADQPLRTEGEPRFQTVYRGTDTPIPPSELPLAQMAATGTIQHVELDIVQASGARIAVESRAVPLVDEGGAIHSGVVVFSDVSDRNKAEEERRRMQAELLHIQAAALAERSTPLIPITDDILVLPLIGSLDAERSAQILDALLAGVSKQRTRVAILDITGVRSLDTHAAAALTSAARALGLVGVEPVLTGIRAEVAQTLVGLGTPLSGIVTHSTLQSGIAYAQMRLEMRLGKKGLSNGRSSR